MFSDFFYIVLSIFKAGCRLIVANLWTVDCNSSFQEVDLQTDKLCEAPMLNKGSAIVIHIKTGNRPYLVNASDAAQSLSAGTVVAAFGRGKFIRHQSNAPASEVSNKEVPYDLSGADAQVLYNGNLTTIYEMVEHRRKSGPSPVIKVNYFETIDQPEEGKPGHFKLKKTHDLRFLPQQTVNVEHEGSANGGDNTASQMNLASLLPVEAWASLLQKNNGNIFCR